MTEQINFEKLSLPIPEEVKTFSYEKQQEVFEYLSEMTIEQKKTYEIAVNHLGTSFNIHRSNGFINWKKNKK